MPIELGTCTDRPFIGPPGASAVLSFNSSHGKGGLEFLQLISCTKSKKQDLIQTLLIYLHPTNSLEDSINDANNHFSEHLKQPKHQYLRWKNFRRLQDIEDLKQQQHEVTYATVSYVCIDRWGCTSLVENRWMNKRHLPIFAGKLFGRKGSTFEKDSNLIVFLRDEDILKIATGMKWNACRTRRLPQAWGKRRRIWLGRQSLACTKFAAVDGMVWFYFDDIIMLEKPWQADAAELEESLCLHVGWRTRRLPTKSLLWTAWCGFTLMISSCWTNLDKQMQRS